MTQVYFTKKHMLKEINGEKRMRKTEKMQQDFILLGFGEEGLMQDRIRCWWGLRKEIG